MPMASIHPAATAPSTLFTDADGNGVQDVGEAALSGQSVDLWLNGNPITSTTTDSNGHYTFNNLWGGDYTVSTWVPSGYTISTPHDSNGTTTATLTGAATTTADIGFWPTLVTVAAVNDAIEGGTAGTFRFTRTGDLSQPLTVYYTVGGTATPTDDYTALSGSVTFGINEPTVDVNVSAVTVHGVETLDLKGFPATARCQYGQKVRFAAKNAPISSPPPRERLLTGNAVRVVGFGRWRKRSTVACESSRSKPTQSPHDTRTARRAATRGGTVIG